MSTRPPPALDPATATRAAGCLGGWAHVGKEVGPQPPAQFRCTRESSVEGPVSSAHQPRRWGFLPEQYLVDRPGADALWVSHALPTGLRSQPKARPWRFFAWTPAVRSPWPEL